MNEYQKEEYIFLFDNYWEDFFRKVENIFLECSDKITVTYNLFKWEIHYQELPEDKPNCLA